jgi:hypothetical protein
MRPKIIGNYIDQISYDILEVTGMTKTKSLVFLLSIIAVNSIFCQENEQNVNPEWINPRKVILIPVGLAFSSGKSFGWGVLVGGAYEGALNRYFSLVGGVRYNFFNQYSINDHRFGLFGQVRFYPQGNSTAKFFISTQITGSIVLISYNDNNAISYMPSISPILGYKSNLEGKSFCSEIWLGYNFDFGEINYPENVSGSNSILSNIILGVVYGFKLK